MSFNELILNITNTTFDCLNKTFITPQDYLILHFTIIGILITLISITSALTKEVRQDLIIKYLLKSRLMKSYLCFITLSFFITYLLYFLKYKYLHGIVFIFFGITFFYTLIFAIKYTLDLNREKFYSIIFEKFKKEINSKKNKIKDSSMLNYSKTQFDSFDSLIKNISYVEKNNGDFIEETKILKRIIEYCVASNNINILFDFFNKDITRIRNILFFDNIIAMFYELKFNSYKNLNLMILYQKLLVNLVKENFLSINNFNRKINTSGRYIKEFLDIRYVGKFKKTENENWIKEFDILISNTINSLYEINKLLINLTLDNKIKKIYLESQLSNLNRVLEHYDYLNETDFFQDYYNPYVDQKKKELADKKMKIIKEQQDFLKEKQLELFYLILYNIDKNELPRDFFELALKIYKVDGFDKYYYKYKKLNNLNLLNYDWFSGGAQSIAPFNLNKYRLLISFYNFLNTGEIDIKKFENENFTDTNHSFEDELGNLTEKFISKYFDYDKKKFKQFKNKILKDITEKKESIKKDKQNYIINSPLKEEYVTKFIKDCKEEWERTQTEISKFMQIIVVDGGSKIKSFFGQYTLFNKKWFLDSFEENVALYRDSGKDFGQSQGKSKLRKILDSINQLFDKKKDKEVIVKDLYSDLNKLIQPNKEYYLFYSSNLNIYSIPNLKWIRKGIETASLSLNNSIVYLCYSPNPENLLFEKNVFILEQYKQGYDKINEPLVVQIETITKDKEIQQILKKNKNFKSKEEVKQMVKIRIAEKFNVTRTKKAKLIRLRV